MAEVDPGIAHFPNLVPRQMARRAPVDMTGCYKHGERQPGAFEPRPGKRIDGQVAIVDREADGPVRQSLTGIQLSDDVVQRHHVVGP